jgi:hypothetical protein
MTALEAHSSRAPTASDSPPRSLLSCHMARTRSAWPARASRGGSSWSSRSAVAAAACSAWASRSVSAGSVMAPAMPASAALSGLAVIASAWR